MSRNDDTSSPAQASVEWKTEVGLVEAIPMLYYHEVKSNNLNEFKEQLRVLISTSPYCQNDHGHDIKSRKV